RRLAKFNGVSVNFERHLKEGEGRSAKEPDTLAQELRSLLGESLLNR
ncbi:MAG: IS1595 family transposase, partial [Gemmobacter sp.]|nr:IS1595 family transposase [Gemmobacter sp.]